MKKTVTTADLFELADGIKKCGDITKLELGMALLKARNAIAPILKDHEALRLQLCEELGTLKPDNHYDIPDQAAYSSAMTRLLEIEHEIDLPPIKLAWLKDTGISVAQLQGIGLMVR